MQAVEGMATSGVVVATMIASMSFVAISDLRIASSDALKAMPEGCSSSSAQCRCECRSPGRRIAGDLGKALRQLGVGRPRATANSRPGRGGSRLPSGSAAVGRGRSLRVLPRAVRRRPAESSRASRRRQVSISRTGSLSGTVSPSRPKEANRPDRRKGPRNRRPTWRCRSAPAPALSRSGRLRRCATR